MASPSLSPPLPPPSPTVSPRHAGPRRKPPPLSTPTATSGTPSAAPTSATHWQEVADAVTAQCLNASLTAKTVVQCRHKMEKLGKRQRLRSLPLPRVINNSSTASPSSWNIAKRRICYKHYVASEVNFQKKYSPLYTSLPRVKQVSKRLICVVAREDLPKQVEESIMETPKEIFLKEYKMPDYYFDNQFVLAAIQGLLPAATSFLALALTLSQTWFPMM